jgi:hypothetical protein
MVSVTEEPDDLAHLHPAARQVALLPAEERLRLSAYGARFAAGCGEFCEI